MKGGVSALYVVFEDDRVKELFDDLNDVRKSENLMKIVKPKAKDLSAESLKNCDTLIIEGVIDYHGKGKKCSWIIP